MRRFKILELLLGCLLTVAIFATGALFAWRPDTAKPRGDISEQNATKKSENAKSPDAELIGPTWLTKDAAGFFAFISALVIGGQAVMFFIQLRYMRIGMRDATIAAGAARDGAIAATDAARIARNAQRPYFTPVSTELRFWGDAVRDRNPFQNMEVHLNIVNIGGGIGFIHSYGIAHEICARVSLGNVPLAIRDHFGRMPLRPDARWEAGAPFDHIQVGDDDRGALIAFKKALYCYGYVRYFDLFGIFRKTGFIFEFIPDENAPFDGTFAMCPHRMWYDEEEPKTS